MNSIATASVVGGLVVLLVVAIDVMAARAGWPRSQRIGLTLLPIWCLMMLVVYGLRLMDDGLELPAATVRLVIAGGAGVMAWALWDLHRGAK